MAKVSRTDVGGAAELLVVGPQVVPRRQAEEVLAGILRLQEVDPAENRNFFLGVAVDGDAVERRHPEHR